jgi:hypothetical protein
MHVTLDEGSLTFRAYMAAVVGPSRRVFGNTRAVPIQQGESLVIARATGDTVLHVSVSLNNLAGPFMFSKNNQPAFLQDVSVSGGGVFTAVLLPGEELNVLSGHNAAATLTVSTVQF